MKKEKKKLLVKLLAGILVLAMLLSVSYVFIAMLMSYFSAV